MAIEQAFQKRPEQQQVPTAQIFLAACGHVVVNALDEAIIRLCHTFPCIIAGEVHLGRADDLKDAVDELVRSVLLPSFTVVLTKEINGVSVGLAGRRESIDRDGFQMPSPVDLFHNIFRRGIAGVVLQRRGLGRNLDVHDFVVGRDSLPIPLDANDDVFFRIGRSMSRLYMSFAGLQRIVDVLDDVFHRRRQLCNLFCRVTLCLQRSKPKRFKRVEFVAHVRFPFQK